MLHGLLPTQTRLNRVTRNVNSPVCVLCQSGEDDDLAHALLNCSHNSQVATWLVEALEFEHPMTSENNILLLDVDLTHCLFGGLAFMYLLAETLSFIFDSRKEKKQCKIFDIRTRIEAKVNILRKSRFSIVCQDLDLMIQKGNKILEI